MVTMVDRCARLSARRALVAQPDRRACASLWHYYGTLGPPQGWGSMRRRCRRRYASRHEKTLFTKHASMCYAILQMTDEKPHLTLVGSDFTIEHDLEFEPLPYYPFEERPSSYPLTQDECATAIHLADGDVFEAAALLKVPIIRVNRLIRNSPRLQRVLDESLGVSLVRAAHVPLRTLRTSTDQRALEWAATKVLQSRLGQGHPLSPAPPVNVQSSVTVDQRRIVVLWGNGEKIAEIGPDDGGPSVEDRHYEAEKGD